MEKPFVDQSRSWTLFEAFPDRAIDVRGFLRSNQVALSTPGCPFHLSPGQRKQKFVNEGEGFTRKEYNPDRDPHLNGFRALRKLKRIEGEKKYPPIELVSPYLIKKGWRRGKYRLPSVDRRSDKKLIKEKMRLGTSRKCLREKKVLPPVEPLQTLKGPASDVVPCSAFVLPNFSTKNGLVETNLTTAEREPREITNEMLLGLPVPLFAHILQFMHTPTIVGSLYYSISSFVQSPLSQPYLLGKVKEVR